MEWKTHLIYTNYDISAKGDVRNNKTMRLLKPRIDSGGYYRVNLSIKGKQKTILVHRLVMELFNPIKNMDELCVDHINGKKLDNDIENLRWVDRLQNLDYGVCNRTTIRDIINDLIQKYGYEKTTEILKGLVDN